MYEIDHYFFSFFREQKSGGKKSKMAFSKNH